MAISFQPFLDSTFRNIADLIYHLREVHGSTFTHKVVADIYQRLHFHLSRPEKSMRRTYQIELKIDFNDAERHDAMQGALRQAAKLAYTQALLLSDGKKPEIALRSEDFFEGTDDIQILTEEDLDEI